MKAVCNLPKTTYLDNNSSHPIELVVVKYTNQNS
jgi:hypothetical protein